MNRPQLKIFPAVSRNQVGFVFSTAIYGTPVDIAIGENVSHDIYEFAHSLHAYPELREFVERLTCIEHVERIQITNNEILITVDDLFFVSSVLIHQQAISTLEFFRESDAWADTIG